MATVLLVDDSPVVRRTLERRLTREGLTVVADDTAAGAGSRDLEDVACAVIDIELPDGSGCELAAALLRAQPSLRVAFFTAGAADDVLARAKAHGPVFWKPELEALVAWVKNAVAPQPPPTK
ncbi:MAG: response regulator [Polyangiaceae bacterium]